MKNTYVISDNIISPLGFSTFDNLNCLNSNISGIKFHEGLYTQIPSFHAAIINDRSIDERFSAIGDSQQYTKTEKIAILSIKDALAGSNIDIKSAKTLILISTTKGNVDLLKNKSSIPQKRVYLSEMVKTICSFFENPNTPVIISNACISGVLAIITAKDLIESSLYDHVVVCGIDTISEFIVSGFQSFMAISSQPCKPFDAKRDGITIGEGCGTVILSSVHKSGICIGEGATSNDANHISGPSRTGDGLYGAIRSVMQHATTKSSEIGYISAHGTGTVYNDEMETKALALADMLQIPVNSLKGYFGHTLGAAGVIETIIGIGSMKQNHVFGSYGLNELGVSSNLNISKEGKDVTIDRCLKLASGFGGCNAALLISKI